MEDCSTDERLQQETLCHRQLSDEYVERPETLMRRHTGTLARAPDHVDICMPKLRPCNWFAQKPSASSSSSSSSNSSHYS